MDLDLNKYGMIGGTVLLIVLVGIYISQKKDNFGSMKKLLQDNTDIDLIRNTDTYTKGTTTKGTTTKGTTTKGTTIIVNNDDFFSKSMTKGELGMGESYMDGDWDSPNLEKTLRELLMNQSKLEKHIYSLEFILLGLNEYIATYLPSNTLESSKDNISLHYDVGNNLYSKMLGKHMQYTCAYYHKDDLTLDEAQYAKMELIAKKLRLEEGLTVLDFGCGFGSLANHLATKYKVHVVGVTLSKEQVKYQGQIYQIN